VEKLSVEDLLSRLAEQEACAAKLQSLLEEHGKDGAIQAKPILTEELKTVVVEHLQKWSEQEGRHIMDDYVEHLAREKAEA